MAKTRRGTTLLSAVMAILMAFSIGFAPAAMPAAAYAQEAQSAAVGDTKSAEAKEDQKAPEANGSKAPAKEEAKTEEHGDKNDGADEASRSAKDKGDDDDDEDPKGPIEVVGDFFIGIVDGIKAAGSVVLNAITMTVDSVIKGIQGANTVDGDGLKPAFRFTWSDNNNASGNRPTAVSENSWSAGVSFYDSNRSQSESADNITVDFQGADTTVVYFGDDEMTYPRYGSTRANWTAPDDEVAIYDIGVPAAVDSALSNAGYWVTNNGSSQEGDYYVTEFYLQNADGMGGGGDPAPISAIAYTGKPAVKIDWAYFNDGSGNPLPTMYTFQIVAYDSNGDQLPAYTADVSESDANWDKTGNGGYLWTYYATTLPDCGTNGVDHYEVSGIYGDCDFSCTGFEQSYVDMTEYTLLSFSASSSGSSDPGYGGGPSWNPNGDTGNPELQISLIGDNGTALSALTAPNAATAYPIVDSNGTRGTGVSFTITASEWGGDPVADLSGLDPVDNTNIYGYEFDMPSITNYTLSGPNYSWGDGNSMYYSCSYQYDPSPEGLKPALKIVWNDNSNPDRPASLGSWSIFANDETGMMINGIYDTFTLSGSGDTWTTTFDSMPAYGTSSLGDNNDQTIANTGSGYQFSWNDTPRYYSIRSELPEVDANYYYTVYSLDYSAPTQRPNPTVRLRWIDQGHTEDRPASVTVNLYDGGNREQAPVDTQVVSGDPDDIVWEYTFTGNPAVIGADNHIAEYQFDLDPSVIDYGTTPYYTTDEGMWHDSYDANWNVVPGEYEITIYHVDGPDPYDYNPYVAHSDPNIIVWWWDEWWNLTQPAYLDVTLYDNGVAQETKRITPNYHGETQATYHGDWQASFPGYADALQESGHDYSFSIAFPDGYSVPGYDLLKVDQGWKEENWHADYRTDEERAASNDYVTSGYWNQWSIFAVPTTTTYNLTRDDSTDDLSSDPVDLEVEVTLPASAGNNHEYLLAPALASNATYEMSVEDGNGDPVSVASASPNVEVDSPIVMTYTPTLNDGDTLSLNLIRGSSVSVRKTGASPSISKRSGTGTQSNGAITFDVGSTDFNTTIEATNSGDSGDEPGDNPGDNPGGVTTEGSITIAQNSMNSGTTYDAYQVFTGPVTTDNGQDKASTLSWAVDSTTQAAIISFLNENGYQTWLAGAGNANASLANNPMLAAQFISEKIADTTASPTAVAAIGTQPRTTTSDSFASGLARVLVQYGTPEATDATAGTAYQNDQGYYLFVTDTSTISGSGNEAGTAPIWAPITDTARVVTEKTEVPTLTSQVTDDDNATPGKAADGNIGQDLTHTLTATMPANVMAFPSYAMTVAETLPSGMSLASNDTSSVAVTLGGVDITNMCGITYENDVLTISASDLRSSDVASALATQGVEFGPDATMVITYNAHLDADAEVGPDGNMTGAVLTYTADPNAESNPTSQAPQQNTYTYANTISLEKLDRETRLALAGVPFTIQDNASGKYVAADGTLSNSAVTHTTASNTGLIEISGVDSGTYTIAEGTPASGYKALSSAITLTITPTYDATGALTGYGVSALGENFSSPVAPALTVGANEDGVSINDSTLMKAGIRVSNLREIVLPLTGMPLGIGIAVYGSILLVISLAVYVRNKRIKDQIAELEVLGE